MKRSAPLMLFVAAATFCGSYVAAQSTWTDRGGPVGGSPCDIFSLISGPYAAAPGTTNGIPGVPQVGETYQITATGPGTGTIRLVGDAGGVVTFAGPGTVPVTLTYTVTSPTPPPGAIGVGFFFDAGAGTVNIAASCSRISVPTLNRWGIAALLGLGALGGIGALFLRRRRLLSK
jgi:hypothetical protein